jgi:CheY-like chemotaxis protein
VAEPAAAGPETWRILVVDDNATNAKLLRAALIPDGHEVSVVTDATAVLGAVHSSTPDLVLMDIQMPVKDGLTLTRELRADPRTRDLVIVGVSAYARPEDCARALEAGCDGYVPKPVDTRALPEVLEAAMSGRREAVMS